MKRRNFIRTFSACSFIGLGAFLEACRKNELLDETYIPANQLTKSLSDNFDNAVYNYKNQHNCWDCQCIYIVEQSKKSVHNKAFIIKNTACKSILDLNVTGIVFKKIGEFPVANLPLLILNNMEYYLKVYEQSKPFALPVDSMQLKGKYFYYVTNDMLGANMKIQRLVL